MIRTNWLLGCLAMAACGWNDHSELDDPARIETTIAPNPLTVGNTASATCTVYNSVGTVLEAQSPTLVVMPLRPGTTIKGLEVSPTAAGHYDAQCRLPGLMGGVAGLEVVPELPAKLLLGKAPDQRAFGLDVAVTITHVVADRYGNPILGAEVTLASTPVTGLGPTTVLSPDSFSYGSEGNYRIAGEVLGPTDANLPVTSSLELIVDQRGPAITCGSPVDGTMLNVVPGAELTFHGSVTDGNGTMNVTVDGAPVTPAADGSFSTSVRSRFGINFVNVVATDGFGLEAAKVCTFVVANRWASASGGFYNDTLSLRLTQATIDDGNRNGAISSLGDMLDAVANSQDLQNKVEHALLAANPLEPLTCNDRLCVPVFGCACIRSSQIDYISSGTGVNSDRLTLVSNGISTQAQVNDLHFTLRVRGAVFGFGYDTTGTADISFISVQLVLSPSLAGGKPHISIGSVSTPVVGPISVNFSGVDGWIVTNVIMPLAQGALVDHAREEIQGYLKDHFSTDLNDLLGGLDISTLGASFTVPRLDTGSVTLGFGVNVSSLVTDSVRMLFGMGSKVTGPGGNQYVSLGVPIPPGTVLDDPSVATSATISAHVGILNQALHALWRANYFAASIDASKLTPFAAGITLDLTTRLPPVATFNGANQLELSLGDVDLKASGPNVPPDLRAITLGVRVHAPVSLVGHKLVFDGIVVDEVHVTSDAFTRSQMYIEDLLKVLVQYLADISLKRALPELPIPSFAVPASLEAFGVPTGEFGLERPTLSISPPHIRLGGSFGID